MRRLFKVFDEDNSGTVSYQEFCHVVFPDLDVEALSNSKEVAKNVQMKHRFSSASVRATSSERSTPRELSCRGVTTREPSSRGGTKPRQATSAAAAEGAVTRQLHVSYAAEGAGAASGAATCQLAATSSRLEERADESSGLAKEGAAGLERLLEVADRLEASSARFARLEEAVARIESSTERIARQQEALVGRLDGRLDGRREEQVRSRHVDGEGTVTGPSGARFDERLRRLEGLLMEEDRILLRDTALRL